MTQRHSSFSRHGTVGTPALLALLGALASFRANVGIGATHDFERRDSACYLEGTLSSADISPLRTNIERGCRFLFLTSNGGNVEAALALGRAVRQGKLSVIVPAGHLCASACVFVYAGAVTRQPRGSLVIHRPYLTGSSESFEMTQRHFVEISQKAKRYLREMNVSDALFDRMMTIAPEDAVRLTEEEMNSWGLGRADPVFLEFVENKRAAKSGMKKEDWLAKKKRTTNRCGALLNVSLTDAERAARRECWTRLFPEYFGPTSRRP